MLRAWKDNTGVPMGGLLIDTLAYNFLQKNPDHWTNTYSSYDKMIEELFTFLSEQKPTQSFWFAPGSNQKVYSKGSFEKKAQNALRKVKKAQLYTGKKAAQSWREIFGKNFPTHQSLSTTTFEKSASSHYLDTEEFIEDMFSVRIQYNLVIDCEVKQNGFRIGNLLSFLRNKTPLLPKKKLKFFIKAHDVDGEFQVKWKVRNVGEEAESRDDVRGQILEDDGSMTREERTSYAGEHFVECYIIKNNVCVARDFIEVPISHR
jgi:hypothetical protein